MSNKKNIDRLFQEKFKDFEVAPNDAVWNRISKELPNNKKRRRVVALWWQIAGVAAVIALLFTVGVSVFNSGETKELPVVDTEKVNDVKEEISNPSTNSSNELNLSDTKSDRVANSSDESSANALEKSTNSEDNNEEADKLKAPSTSYKKSNSTVAHNDTKINEKSTPVEEQRKAIIKSTEKDNTSKVADNTNVEEENSAVTIANESEIKSAIKQSINNKNTAVTENSSSDSQATSTSSTKQESTKENETESTIVENPDLQSIEDAIAAQKENTTEKEKDDKLNRWSIAPNVAPVYFGSLGEGSPIDEQFVTNTKSADINMSYGIAGSYAISKRFKVRAGINRVNLNHVTTDVIAFTGNEALMRGENMAMRNIKYKNHDHSVSFMHAKKYNSISKVELFNPKQPGEIDQRFGFIEVPLELEYRLLDKKFGINVIGGFSTFFLSNNEIYADINGTSTLIGEANNINSTSFSANFGLGLDYSLSTNWNLNLEPQFKYQLNTFNNTSGSFRPFFIGVYTGLSFKF